MEQGLISQRLYAIYTFSCDGCPRPGSSRTRQSSPTSTGCSASCGLVGLDRGLMNPELAPYEALAALARVRTGAGRRARLRRPRRADARRAPRSRACCRPSPPAAARPTLERCLALQQRVRVEMLRVREAILLELGQVRHGQRPPPATRPPAGARCASTPAPERGASLKSFGRQPKTRLTTWSGHCLKPMEG